MAKDDFEERGQGVAATLARPGGLSYMEIPALDVDRSATFYEQVLGWNIDRRDPEDPRFQDPTGHLIGRWRTARAITSEAGLMPYFYVDGIDDAIKRVEAHGGEVFKSPFPEGMLWVASVRDPAGNMIGLWQLGPR